MLIEKLSSLPLVSRLVERATRPRLPDIGLVRGDKPRVLCFVTKYPEFSETYIHEEMVAIDADYELRILDYERSRDVRANALPHIFIKYRGSNLAYGAFKHVDTRFTSAVQRGFIAAVDHVMRKFRPDVMHGHYFPNAWLMRFLADRHDVPFTVRTHSFDMLNIEPARMRSMMEAVDTPRCLAVFTYPEFRDVFLSHGIPAEKVREYWPICNVGAFYDETPREPTGRVMCAGPCTPKKAHRRFVDLAHMMQGSGYEFSLYAKGFDLERIQRYNAEKGNPVHITYADPEEMPAVYRRYDWLVYPLQPKINKVGLPVAVAEAQAAGIGVCLQESPGRRQAQLDFLGGGGYLFRSIEDVPALISKPYPEEMRLNGLRNCWKCDVSVHKHMLDEAWRTVNSASRNASAAESPSRS